MLDDLKDMVDVIDELEDEIWRQRQKTPDPALKEWCESNVKTISKMKSELSRYIAHAESAVKTRSQTKKTANISKTT